MLFGIEVKIAERPRGFSRSCRGHYAMRTRELGHDETAPALIANQAAENRIRNPCHGCEYRCRSNLHWTNLECAWNHLSHFRTSSRATRRKRLPRAFPN